MTKAQQRKLARRARRYGHFNDQGERRVRCPIDGCGAWVRTHRLSFTESVPRSLDAAVIDHLNDEHGEQE